MKHLLGIAALLLLTCTGVPDVPEPYGPKLTYRKVPQSTGCASVFLDNGILYTVGYEGLTVYRVEKEPEKPERIAVLNQIKGGRQMVKCGSRIYVAARNFGLWIADVSIPESPRLVKRYDTIELATGISAKGNLLFIAQRGYGVQILDISEPDDPKHLSLLLTDEAQSVTCRGTTLFIGDWGSGKLTLGDISDPLQPKLISRTSLDGCGDGVAVKGELCYAATGHHSRKGPAEQRFGRGHGVEVFDVSNRRRPQKIGGIKFPKMYDLSGDFWNVKIADRFLLASDTLNGFFLLDVSDPRNLKCRGHLILAGEKKRKLPDGSSRYETDAVSWAEAGRNVVYVTGQSSGLYTVPVPGMKPVKKDLPEKIRISPGKPREYNGLIRYDAGGMVRRAAPYGKNMAYLACSGKGIHLVRISGNRIDKIAEWKKDCSYDVAVRNGFLYSLENTGELAVYKTGRDGGLEETGRISLPWEIFYSLMLSSDGRFAVCRAYGRLYFFDVSDPSAPRQVFFHSSGAILYSDTLPERDINGMLPVNCHFAGVVWYDLTGKTPKYLDRIPGRLSGQMNGLTGVGGHFILPLDSGTLCFLDPGSRRPASSGELSLPGEKLGGIPSFDGSGTLVFSERRKGTVQTYQLDGLKQIRRIPERCFQLPGATPDRVTFLNGRMLIPGGHAGLLVEKEQKSKH